MRIRILFILIGVLWSLEGHNQVIHQSRIDSIINAHILSGDSIPHIELAEVAVLPKQVFKNRREERQYWKLVYNLKKVLPYSKVIAATVKEVDGSLSELAGPKERRRYIKSVEDSLWSAYEQDMRKMTITQGRLLFKLVDRETQATTYYWIEQYRGSVSAFFWQGIARIFSSNLKESYDAEGADKLIEQLIGYIEKGYI